MNEKRINKHIFVWIGNFLVGHVGVDRFMRGHFQASLQLMTLGIWFLTC